VSPTRDLERRIHRYLCFDKDFWLHLTELQIDFHSVIDNGKKNFDPRAMGTWILQNGARSCSESPKRFTVEQVPRHNCSTAKRCCSCVIIGLKPELRIRTPEAIRRGSGGEAGEREAGRRRPWETNNNQVETRGKGLTTMGPPNLLYNGLIIGIMIVATLVHVKVVIVEHLSLID
jgi:hypothetical protein